MARRRAEGLFAVFLVVVLVGSFKIRSTHAAVATTKGSCQDVGGAMLPDFPGGDACDDSTTPINGKTCKQLFGPDAVYDATTKQLTTEGKTDRGTGMRNEACDWTEQVFAAKQCAKTCAICCLKEEFACKNPDNPPQPCTAANKAMCDNDMSSIMKLACPALCGTCPLLNQDPNCRDTVSLVTCTQSKALGLCTNSGPTLDKMRRECPRTCGFCQPGQPGVLSNNTQPLFPQPQPPRPLPTIPGVPGGGLPAPGRPGNRRDLADNCYRNRKLCDSDTYARLMARDCAGTCRKYFRDESDDSGDNDDSDCYDESDNCEDWDLNYNFCNNDWYSDEDKEDKCAYTCGFCE